MRSKKFMLCASVCMLVSAMSLTGQAAEQQDKPIDANKAKTQPQVVAKVPIVIDADKLSFSDSTGALFADGNVSVVQNGDKILTDSMRGNSKQTELWIDGKADFIRQGEKLTGTGTQYNYTQRTGSMNNVIGNVSKQHITAKTVDILSTDDVLLDGTATGCPAIVPCYHVSATKIEIWPGDKMIAYNAKFWVRNVVIFTLPKYQISLKKNAAGIQESFPLLGYTNTDGLSIKQHLDYPISDHVVAFADLWYYSKAGFKPQYGVTDKEKSYSLNLVQGDYRDANGYWITKEPELNVNFYSHHLDKIPVSYTFSGIYGKWTDSTKSSWHQDYNMYFTRDTINLSKTLSLNMGAGVEQTRESYDSSVVNNFKFNTTLTKVVSPKLTAWTAYNNTTNNTSLFVYNSTSLTKEWVNGFSYKIDPKDSVAYSQSYDLQNKQVYSNTYTWKRDLHCWQLAIAYTAYTNPTPILKNQLTWNLSTTVW